MSIVPYVLQHLLQDTYDPLDQLYDQHFGLGLLNDDLVHHRPSVLGLTAPLRSGYLRASRHLQPQDSGISAVTNKRDSFDVNLDVQQFKPEEVSVKVVDDYLVVEGKHEEKQDKHGYISRQFTRRYKLPENVNYDAIKSTISSDGVLSIAAPKKVEAIKDKEVKIPVIRTNQPALKQSKGAGDKPEKMET